MPSKSPSPPDVLTRLSRARVPSALPDLAVARRMRIVAAIGRTMERDAARRLFRTRLYRGVVVAAAAVVVLALGLTIRRAPMPSVVGDIYTFADLRPEVIRSGELLPPSTSGRTPVPSRSQVTTGPASSSLLKLRSGAEVTVEERTRLTLPDANATPDPHEELSLAIGLVRVKVPKLPSGHFFSIRTPDAVVSVHGTAFSVEVTGTDSGRVRTKVVVTDGRVSVQSAERSILLGPGTESDLRRRGERGESS